MKTSVGKGVAVNYGNNSLMIQVPLQAQVEAIRRIFDTPSWEPTITSTAPFVRDAVVSSNADKWLAFPKFECLNASYKEAILLVGKLICMCDPRVHFFFSPRLNSPEISVERTFHTKKGLLLLEAVNPGKEILVAPIQWGGIHRGVSPSNVRVMMQKAQGEFGLGIFEVLVSFLVAHHLSLDSLFKTFFEKGNGIICVGDEVFDKTGNSPCMTTCFWGYRNAENKNEFYFRVDPFVIYGRNSNFGCASFFSFAPLMLQT